MQYSENTENESFIKYDTRNIPHDFMSDNDFVQNLHETVFKLERDADSQNDIDNAYTEFSTLLKQEMAKKLSCKTVKMQSSSNNKNRKISKPWVER